MYVSSSLCRVVVGRRDLDKDEALIAEPLGFCLAVGLGR